MTPIYHPGYFRDSRDGQEFYRCVTPGCKYDTFVEMAMRQHVKIHPKMALPPAKPYPERSKIAINLLTWNNSRCATRVLAAIRREQIALEEAGHETFFIWADNASDDGTRDLIQGPCAGRFMSTSNVGQSLARNLMIKQALRYDCEYVLMVDGDVEIIPGSINALMNEFAANSMLACCGFYSRGCTSLPTLVSEYCPSVEGLTVQGDLTAWTQYGLFDANCLAHVEFDEAQPFQGPGWGFEDDDLGFQFMEKGWQSSVCKYYTYGHYNLHSSWDYIDRARLRANFNERREYVYNKWKDNPRLDVQRKALHIRNQTMG